MCMCSKNVKNDSTWTLWIHTLFYGFSHIFTIFSKNYFLHDHYYNFFIIFILFLRAYYFTITADIIPRAHFFAHFKFSLDFLIRTLCLCLVFLFFIPTSKRKITISVGRHKPKFRKRSVNNVAKPQTFCQQYFRLVWHSQQV